MEIEFKQEVKDRIHDDHYSAELVAETVPQNDIQWKYFREMMIASLEGGNVNYEQVGRMFIDEAIDYVVDGVKKDI